MNLLIETNFVNFIIESNKIEGIHREPTGEEMVEFNRFMELPEVTIGELSQFVSVYQPSAVLRRQSGMDVRVGNYHPPGGGPKIIDHLEGIVDAANRMHKMFDGRYMWPHAFEIHNRYESLHPFTDGNGRSGRMLWMWMMRQAPLGFLHTWYYQSLQGMRV